MLAFVEYRISRSMKRSMLQRMYSFKDFQWIGNRTHSMISGSQHEDTARSMFESQHILLLLELRQTRAFASDKSERPQACLILPFVAMWKFRKLREH